MTLLFVFVFFCPLITYSWNTLGHMVIANIAYQNLKPSVRTTVDNLVAYFHQEYPNINSFLEISYWPDAIRAQKIETYTHWHYIDMPFSQDGTSGKNTIDTDNAVWAINNIKPIVKNSHANLYERVRFLSLLTHIVSDLHQPLHTVTYVSAKYPEGDKGGNLYLVRINGKQINLHKLWDGGVGLFANDATPERVNEVTNIITTHYPVSYFGDKVSDLNSETWLKEGMTHAKQYVYTTPEKQIPSSDYIDKGKQLSEQQAALAGYRVANLLNQLMGESTPFRHNQ